MSSHGGSDNEMLAAIIKPDKYDRKKFLNPTNLSNYSGTFEKFPESDKKSEVVFILPSVNVIKLGYELCSTPSESHVYSNSFTYKHTTASRSNFLNLMTLPFGATGFHSPFGG